MKAIRDNAQKQVLRMSAETSINMAHLHKAEAEETTERNLLPRRQSDIPQKTYWQDDSHEVLGGNKRHGPPVDSRFVGASVVDTLLVRDDPLDVDLPPKGTQRLAAVEDSDLNAKMCEDNESDGASQNPVENRSYCSAR